MTRKSYNELAADLKNLRNEVREGFYSTTVEPLPIVDHTIDIVIAALQRDNSHFDKTKFLNAIGR